MIYSGLEAFDKTVQGLQLGDNVVWQVDTLADYHFFVQPFVDQAITDKRKLVYLRFASHEPILSPQPGLEILEVDPHPGFDAFTTAVHKIIGEHGEKTFYVFDNLSALVGQWATDELLANFFQVTCPYLFKLDTVTYFALTRGQHAYHAIARIRETTQLLINIYNAKGHRYVHPLKVWQRYSPEMFLPHIITDEGWQPILSSVDATEVHTLSSKQPLGSEASVSAPWDIVYGKLRQIRETGQSTEITQEILALTQQFSQMMLGNQPDFQHLAAQYFTLGDLLRIHDRLIGRGRIGGKAAGMLLARQILSHSRDNAGISANLENHDSFYVGSDVFFTFLVNNNLYRLRLKLLEDSDYTLEDFVGVEERFLAGEFPTATVEQFRNMLDYYGQAPIIARSSSLLEDGFGNSFAGKYHSEFCANQGPPEERLRAFLRAIKLVYASALNPDVLAYRRRWGLVERDEQMAVLVQRVSGTRFRHFFFPTLAGVALSHNLYVWASRIDPSQGVIRLVYGLGTRAVNRVGSDYPRMIPISHPHLRPEIGTAIAKYAQRLVDVIDLKDNAFITLPFKDLIGNSTYPNLHLLISEYKDGGIYDPISRNIHRGGEQVNILTFNNLLRQTDFVTLIANILAELERAYGRPVETEFTAFIDKGRKVRINLLQCRPMSIPGIKKPVYLPENIAPESVLFKSTRFIGAGVVSNIRYLVYIDPESYTTTKSIDKKREVRAIIGKINARLRDNGERIILLGPGRFGSSDINLGVNVRYADIDNAAVLVEIGSKSTDHAPEVSYGTHFFQDLVESQMLYLAVFPHARRNNGTIGSGFNQTFFTQTANNLVNLVPEALDFADIIKVIDISAVSDGQTACLVADPQRQHAICYLTS